MNDKCVHEWAFDHTVYSQGDGTDQDQASVHRQCRLCGVHQIGMVEKWKAVKVGSTEKWDVPEIVEEST